MANRPVALVDPYPRQMVHIFSPDDLERLYSLVEVVWGHDEPMPLDAAQEALHGAEAVITTGWRYGDALHDAPRLRAILEVGGAFPSRLNYEECFRRGIRVLCCAPAFGRQVAEMALGLTLAATRNIVACDRQMRARNEKWARVGNEDTFLLYDKPVGFIGYGSLARNLQPLLAPFGCRIMVCDPWLSEGYLRRQRLEPVELEVLLERSRVIFVLAVPTVENRALLSRERLERIQPGAVLVLISRAHIVDFEALTELLREGRFKAAIDVYPREPLAEDHPIRDVENVVLSAHRAGSVPEGHWEIGEMVVDDLESMLNGFPPQRMQVAQPELLNRYATVQRVENE